MISIPKISPLLLLVCVASCAKTEGPRFSPQLPLSTAQSDLLSKIEKLPMPDRRAFIGKHMKEIIGFSKENKTFGDRMNAAMGIKPPEP